MCVLFLFFSCANFVTGFELSYYYYYYYYYSVAFGFILCLSLMELPVSHCAVSVIGIVAVDWAHQ
jgi:hypothetical protein